MFHEKNCKKLSIVFVITRVCPICVYNMIYLDLLFYVNILSENKHADYLH